MQTPALILIYFLHSFKLWIFFTLLDQLLHCGQWTLPRCTIFKEKRFIKSVATEISDGETIVSLPIDSMKKMMNNAGEYHSDVVLICQDAQVDCHKSILCLKSSYFKVTIIYNQLMMIQVNMVSYEKMFWILIEQIASIKFLHAWWKVI